MVCVPQCACVCACDVDVHVYMYVRFWSWQEILLVAFGLERGLSCVGKRWELRRSLSID